MVPLNVVVCPDGLTKDTSAGYWVNTTGNPPSFHIPNNCLEATSGKGVTNLVYCSWTTVVFATNAAPSPRFVVFLAFNCI